MCFITLAALCDTSRQRLVVVVIPGAGSFFAPSPCRDGRRFMGGPSAKHGTETHSFFASFIFTFYGLMYSPAQLDRLDFSAVYCCQVAPAAVKGLYISGMAGTGKVTLNCSSHHPLPFIMLATAQREFQFNAIWTAMFPPALQRGIASEISHACLLGTIFYFV